METLAARLKARGWRVTAQRRAICDTLAGEHVHLTADEVYERAREMLPEVSRATVYNTLNELVEMGELHELAHADGRRRFDPNIEQRHHHLVCVDCGRILDVHADVPDLDADQQHGFELLAVEITFRARCPGCRGASDATVTTPA